MISLALSRFIVINKYLTVVKFILGLGYGISPIRRIKMLNGHEIMKALAAQTFEVGDKVKWSRGNTIGKNNFKETGVVFQVNANSCGVIRNSDNSVRLVTISMLKHTT